MNLHLKTAEELLLLLGALAGCCQWETVPSNAAGAKKCEFCRCWLGSGAESLAPVPAPAGSAPAIDGSGFSFAAKIL